MSEGRPFHFQDVHSFKDFLGMVIVCAPDNFVTCDWLSAAEQTDLKRAFEGLSYGLNLVEREFGTSDGLNRARVLVSESLEAYRSGSEIAGQQKLEVLEQWLSSYETE